MGALIFNGVGAVGAQGRRKAASRALKGRRRKAVIKLRDALRVVISQDAKEQDRGDILGYVPYLFLGSEATEVSNAMDLLASRADEALREVLN